MSNQLIQLQEATVKAHCKNFRMRYPAIAQKCWHSSSIPSTNRFSSLASFPSFNERLLIEHEVG